MSGRLFSLLGLGIGVLALIILEIYLVDRGKAPVEDEGLRRNSSPRFVAEFPGLGRDRMQGMLWTLCPVGMRQDEEGDCVGTPREFTLAQAARVCAELQADGRDGWRLPTADELVEVGQCRDSDLKHCFLHETLTAEERTHCARKRGLGTDFWAGDSSRPCLTGDGSEVDCGRSVRLYSRGCGDQPQIVLYDARTTRLVRCVRLPPDDESGTRPETDHLPTPSKTLNSKELL